MAPAILIRSTKTITGTHIKSQPLDPQQEDLSMKMKALSKLNKVKIPMIGPTSMIHTTSQISITHMRGQINMILMTGQIHMILMTGQMTMTMKDQINMNLQKKYKPSNDYSYHENSIDKFGTEE